MKLREQVEALNPDGLSVDVNYVERQAVLDLIDAHNCRTEHHKHTIACPDCLAIQATADNGIDPERLARAMRVTLVERGWYINVSEGTSYDAIAAIIAAAYEEQR